MLTAHIPGLTAVSALAAVAILHAYWALGGDWPGVDRTDLARKVVGTNVFPSATATWGVVVLLVLAGAIVGASDGLWSLPLASGLIQLGSWGVAGVLSARAVFGFVSSGRVHVRGTRTLYTVRDLVAYSPFTLGLAVLVALVARESA